MALTLLLCGLIKDLVSPNKKGDAFKGAAGRHHDNATCIPAGQADIEDKARDVFIASRVVQGSFSRDMFGNFTKVVKVISASGWGFLPTAPPDLTHHWCVTVGDYLHQLQATSLIGGWIYYGNDRMKRIEGGWDFYRIGSTKFNDIAIKDAGESWLRSPRRSSSGQLNVFLATQVVNELPEVFHVLDNSCQVFTVRLLDKILKDGRPKLFTANMVSMATMFFGRQRVSEMRVGDLKSAVDTEVSESGAEPVVEDCMPASDHQIEEGNEAEVAVIKDPEALVQALQQATAIMVTHTPKLDLAEVEQQNETKM